MESESESESMRVLLSNNIKFYGMSDDSMIANKVVYIKLLCNNINNRPKYVQKAQILFSTCFSRQGIHK